MSTKNEEVVDNVESMIGVRHNWIIGCDINKDIQTQRGWRPCDKIKVGKGRRGEVKEGKGRKGK